MIEDTSFFPQISTEFCFRNKNHEFYRNNAFHSNHTLYTDALKNILINILPKDFFCDTTSDPTSLQKTKKALHELLPLLTSCIWSEKPFKCLFLFYPNIDPTPFVFLLK